ncbi:universal stress protein [Paenibacillus thermotolerans]|uniref:universal stress protein n=1 Tax=Paenibacillus thermotolerans TaxID=3027807 RepID=UPI0023683C76|nr:MULTISPECIES: universal stress protein [unclassified Paenibacillus]
MHLPNASVTLLQGYPSQEIIEYAENNGCDLIVLGSRTFSYSDIGSEIAIFLSCRFPRKPHIDYEYCTLYLFFNSELRSRMITK